MTKLKEMMRKMALGFFEEGLLPNESVLPDTDGWNKAIEVLRDLTLKAIDDYHEEVVC